MNEITIDRFSKHDMDALPNNMSMIFEDITKHYSFQKILDYGCGNGIVGSWFKDNLDNIHLTGVDGSDYGCEGAQSRGYDEVIKCHDFNVSSIPLATESIDFVLSKDVCEHLVNPIQVLCEINRVLKDGGVCLLHIPNHFPIKYRIKFLFTNNIDTQLYFPYSNQHDFPHLRFFTESGIRKILDITGFEIIEDYSHHFATKFPIITKLNLVKRFERYLARRSCTHFSSAFTFMMKKK